MTFEKKLKALRKKNRMSQEEMAERLNVSRQAIGKCLVATPIQSVPM